MFDQFMHFSLLFIQLQQKLDTFVHIRDFLEHDITFLHKGAL